MFAAPQKSLMGKLPSISMNLAKTLPVRARGIPGKGMIKLAITGSIPQDYFGDHVNPNLWCKAKITYSNSSDTIFFSNGSTLHIYRADSTSFVHYNTRDQTKERKKDDKPEADVTRFGQYNSRPKKRKKDEKQESTNRAE